MNRPQLADDRSRSHAIELVARQIAIAQGLVWNKLSPKSIAVYITLAGNCTATIERMMLSYSWDR